MSGVWEKSCYGRLLQVNTCFIQWMSWILEIPWPVLQVFGERPYCAWLCFNMCDGCHHRVLCLRGDNAKHCDNGQPQDTREFNVADSSTSQSNVAVKKNNETSVKSGTAAAHSSASLSVLGVTTQNRYRILLQTLRVTILLDTGCDRSYICSALVRRVEPRWVESKMLSYAPFGSKESGKCALRNVFSLDLVGTSKNNPSWWLRYLWFVHRCIAVKSERSC